MGIAYAKAPIDAPQVRTWSPPGSSLRVEFSNALLNLVRAQAVESDAAGVLFGVRRNRTVRLVEAGTITADPPPPGLEHVGIFAARPRGEVFLTEADLERFKKTESTVALVVAGTRAGFFVHESDGSLQSIKSHREIPISRGRRQVNRWLWPVVVIFAVCLLAAQHWRSRPPARLAVVEKAGQLRITWDPASFAGRRENLEIRDGDASIAIPVTSFLASATYLRRTAEVRIRLGSESVRFIDALSTMDLGH